MKVRFGISLGANTPHDQLASTIDHLETSGVDSLWFSELVYSPAVDPVVGMAYALARTEHLKVGTSVAVPPGRARAVSDEPLRILRAVLLDEPASYSGRYFTVTAAAVAPRPNPPLDIWLGGSAPAAFRRIGTLADGWLGSFLTPDEARAGRRAIERAAAEAGRQIEPDHFGISLAVADGELPAELAAAGRRRRADRSPAGLGGAHRAW